MHKEIRDYKNSFSQAKSSSEKDTRNKEPWISPYGEPSNPQASLESSSMILLNKKALQNNLEVIKNLLKPGVELCSVVKGNAYGHGIQAFVKLAMSCGQKKFAVFSIEEAINLDRASEGKADIMIMGWMISKHLEWVISRQYSFYIFDLERIEEAIEYSKICNKKARIHLEFETGMNRTGIPMNLMKEAFKIVNDNTDYLELVGVCTHFAGAESFSNHLRVKSQIEKFKQIKEYAYKIKVVPQYFHSACSAAVVNYPETQFDMVRVGIFQYGYWPNNETFVRYITDHNATEDPLKSVISWKSTIMSVKSLKKGDYAGYGTSYRASDDMQIAVIPVGYANGYSRALSNQGRIIIKNNRVGVLGTINMNMTLVDVTGIENIQIGDEVILIGRQGELKISVASFGELSNMLNYELLTRLPKDIPRLVDE